MTYRDLGLVQPEGGDEIGERLTDGHPDRLVPELKEGGRLALI